MKLFQVKLLILLLYSIDFIESTCVLESEFGFTVNCNFKQSGLFRIRNLGGVKAHIGLGFSVGDELGFPESLSNIEGNRRRALNFKTGLNTIQDAETAAAATAFQQSSPKAVTSPEQMVVMSSREFSQQTPEVPVPVFKPIPSPNSSEQKQTSPAEARGEADLDDNNSVQLDLKGLTIEELALKANVSQEVIKKAIANREKQLTLEKRRKINAEKIRQRIKAMKRHKVMNAPREYYPVGYDKNFDDNFKSKIDLPTTSFHCGDQKHFPGLYADVELNCMVFHVCAVTDDGLIMKSFLCPESTLFDQSILKCNWWFYTDCKSSKSLYDSNLPVAKSYQLMKSLFYFNNNYKKQTNDQNTKHHDKSSSVEVLALKDSVNKISDI